MQTEEILSAGIDIGTSTTQLVFSRMILQNTGGFGRIPQIKVVSSTRVRFILHRCHPGRRLTGSACMRL